MKFIDVPKYIVRPKPNRFLIDKVLILLLLGGLLYLGVFVNYYLLDTNIPTYWNIIIVVGIVIILALELILCYLKYSNYSYEFHEEYIKIADAKSKTINYHDILTVEYSANIIDKKLNIATIILKLKDGSNVKLKYLDNPNQAFTWIQKMLKV